MTALTAAQLDAIERNAKAEMGTGFWVSVHPEHALRLVAIARAALAWQAARQTDYYTAQEIASDALEAAVLVEP